MRRIPFSRLPFVLLAAALLAARVAAAAEPLAFAVKAGPGLLDGPFTGRVVVYLTKGNREPRFGPNWFRPEPIYSTRVKAAPAGAAMEITTENAVGFPCKLSELPAGEYSVQAVIDRSLGGRAIGASPGNLYSQPVRLDLDPSATGRIEIVCDSVVQERPFRDTEHVKGVRLQSKLLSDWYRRPTWMSAAVVLPDSYAAEPNRRFPVIYEVPGFGGTHMSYSGAQSSPGTLRNGESFLKVVLDPSCPTGHSVFADSDNNGPWGKALTTELIPHIERTFRAIGKPGARFVTGHSSGGWSSLWLQVTYPEFFGGVWSTSPDPVDFRDFQKIDLYRPNANMFTDENGQPRPVARIGGRVAILYRQFSDMERPIRGEQLGSFEAVFSPRGADGDPKQLWDRDTGAIDPKVAAAWKRYDIGLTLRNRWAKLGPKLAGKLHVYMGDMDTFYLDGAVQLLQADFKRLGSDAKVELFPGDHGSVMTRALRERIDAEMAAQFQRWHAANP
jgi:S-formylglutathione hydrolase FrmB